MSSEGGKKLLPHFEVIICKKQSMHLSVGHDMASVLILTVF